MKGLSMIRYTQSELKDVLGGRHARGSDAIDDADDDFEAHSSEDSSLSADSFGSGSTADNSTAYLIDRDNMIASGHAESYGIIVGSDVVDRSPSIVAANKTAGFKGYPTEKCTPIDG